MIFIVFMLLNLVSQLKAEYDGAGLGIGSQVHTAQRRRRTLAGNVGIEAVVFLPQIEIFARDAPVSDLSATSIFSSGRTCRKA